MSIQPGARIGRYQVVRQIGLGGMAATFLCALEGIGGFEKRVVVKVLRPELVDDESFVRMFLDEARTCARFSHPNIPTVFEVGDLHGLPYLVMEYIHGPTLSRLGRDGRADRPASLPHYAWICAQVARALDYTYHEQDGMGVPLRVVHRDVSLNNILVSTRGVPKLIDFGIAMAENRMSQTEVGTYKGKLQYLAPEQLRGQNVDHRTDLFQLGVSLYRLMTGRRPYTSTNLVQLWSTVTAGEFARPSTFVERFSPAMEAILVQALQPDPEARWQRGSELALVLEEWVAAETTGSGQQELARWIQGLYPNGESGWVGIAGDDTPSGRSAFPTRTDDSSVLRQLTPPAVVQASSVRRSWSGLGIGLGVVGVCVALLAVLLAGFAVLNSVSPSPLPVQAAVAPARVTPDETGTALLDEAERSLDDRQYTRALDLIGEVDRMTLTDANVRIRGRDLRARAERRVALDSAERHLAAGDTEDAAELARSLLDRDGDDVDALDILSRVRELGIAARAARPAPRAVAFRRVAPRVIRPATLNLQVSPPGKVYVDDLPIGTSPVDDYRIEPGEHVIHIRREGFETLRRDIEVGEGANLVLELSLLPREAAPKVVTVVTPEPPTEVVASSRERASDLATEPLLSELPAATPVTAVVAPVAPPERESAFQPAPPDAAPRKPGAKSAGVQYAPDEASLTRLLQAAEDLAVKRGVPVGLARGVTTALRKAMVSAPRPQKGYAVPVEAIVDQIVAGYNVGLSRPAISSALKRGHAPQ